MSNHQGMKRSCLIGVKSSGAKRGVDGFKGIKRSGLIVVKSSGVKREWFD